MSVRAQYRLKHSKHIYCFSNSLQLLRRSVRTYAGQTAVQASVPRSRFGGESGSTEFAQILNGCWQLAGGHGTDLFNDIQSTLQAQYDAGFTTFDTADIYGPSEGILGEFVQRCKSENKPSPEIFTKYVPNIFRGVPNASQIEQAVKKSCTSIGTNCLDLVQLHWWDYSVPGMVDTALRLMELKQQGLIKNIGVTNLNVEAVEKLLDAGVELVSNQVQFSLVDRRPLNGMLQLCEQNNMKLFTYGSLAGGLLSDKYVEEPRKGLFGKVKFSNVHLNTSSLKMYWNVMKLFGGQELWRELLLVLRIIANDRECSIANVVLAWTVAQSKGGIIHPIIGLRKPVHIEDNLRMLNLKLSEGEMSQIQEVLDQAQGPKGDIYSFERAG